MEKSYQPSKYEDNIYRLWEKSNYFNPDKLPKRSANQRKNKAFTIVLPPPNVTGQLHVGHTLMLAIEDLIVRFKRMQGYTTLWLPGTDHAAIATQNVVEKSLLKQGKTREKLGREQFIAECWKWTHQYHDRIVKQIKKIGASLDWSRERFTMDKAMSTAVNQLFIQMYQDGLIYQGKRLINWCPRCQSSLADDEVEYQDTTGAFYYIKYPFKNNPKQHLTIATTRPETMLGDTAVAVNPKDKRYKQFIGQELLLPLTNRTIPIIADEHVTLDMGTGALKVTPAHDPDDYEIGQRHNLPIINLLSKDGKLNKNGGIYQGIDCLAARQKVIDDLKIQNLFIKEEPIVHRVGHCYRCQTIIEPIISKQWFINVNKKIKQTNKTLRQLASEAVTEKSIRIIPERFNKTYFQWIDNLHDWCISRQIWWGHRLPIWYCQQCNEIITSVKKPNKCPKCHSHNLVRDEDTLDTWFSSALWPFSTLGWPNQSKDYQNFYPTDVLETGYDILFFWVARMIMMGIYATGKCPFHTVYLHGLVCDQRGKKMSKSKGNVIEPLSVAEKYGADALRLSFILGNSPGNNLNLDERKIAGFRNFINKLWNISRFISGQTKVKKQNPLHRIYEGTKKIPRAKTVADQWILSRLDETIDFVTQKIEQCNFSLAGEHLYDFTWHDLADWYLEISKVQINDLALKQNTQQILLYSLDRILKLWHPFIPFVTEQIYQDLFNRRWINKKKGLLLIQVWPRQRNLSKQGKKDNQQILGQFNFIQQIIISLRNFKTDQKIKAKQVIKVYIIQSKHKELIRQQQQIITRLTKTELFFTEPSIDQKYLKLEQTTEKYLIEN